MHVLFPYKHNWYSTKLEMGRLNLEITMNIEEEYIDVVLVPAGLLIMLVYHLFLLHMYLNKPLSTAIGYDNNDKRIWVGKFLQGDDHRKSVKTALNVISSSTTATINLAAISLTLCALIGAWMANNFFPSELVYGNTSASTVSIKYMGLLTCFLIGFSCFVQSSRHFVHSNFLLSTPGVKDKSDVKKLENAVQRGSELWLLGLRALYCALNILLWFFGPIPMFVSSIVLVSILCCHDLKKSDNQNGINLM